MGEGEILITKSAAKIRLTEIQGVPGVEAATLQDV